MTDKAQLLKQAERASEDMFAWTDFVAQTEFLWQDNTLIEDAEAWQSLWYELEILSGLALAEWEEQGRPADWSAAWHNAYQQDARELAAELMTLIA
ncbi:hypothetical protein [Pseudomonas capsici]|uniref:Uncharacterized protein n=1 Tax=Pseudomonas capsici TaxID=2810614 RepID=A0ABT3C3I8_9PSED|nr:hypothetical protein [Pseudomonas capsici]MBN6715487.1 hypothetical protein [Pseudomonas capsici]MBN6720396.1 hypothetical protein [Pseudomonas capsici]MBN6725394.1 hypothetical protein [Pseudomonas capsici]MCV4270728.1 hypothetical protein [Pseudomonas capsici]MCV4280922.1 hypothetical protein [Pseudomonas capsici]